MGFANSFNEEIPSWLLKNKNKKESKEANPSLISFQMQTNW